MLVFDYTFTDLGKGMGSSSNEPNLIVLKKEGKMISFILAEEILGLQK